MAVLALSVCSYELGRHQAGQVKKESNRVSYIDGDQAGQKAENLTPDEVSKREGINVYALGTIIHPGLRYPTLQRLYTWGYKVLQLGKRIRNMMK